MRIFSIAHLCIAFTVVLWNLSQPFVGDLFQAKANLLVYDEVMGNVPLTETPESEEWAEKNRAWFQLLPKSDQRLIASGYARAVEKKGTPFFAKLKASFVRLATQIPPFEQAWLLLSLVAPILLLKQVEGSRQIVWLLPLLTIAYIADNQWNGTIPALTAQERLFPTEQLLLEKYVKERLSPTIAEQHAQLKTGWNLYLIDAWLHEEPAQDTKRFQEQLARGEYAFTVARAKTLASSDSKSQVASFHKEPLSILLAFLIWNVAFSLASSRWYLVSWGKGTS